MLSFNCLLVIGFVFVAMHVNYSSAVDEADRASPQCSDIAIHFPQTKNKTMCGKYDELVECGDKYKKDDALQRYVEAAKNKDWENFCTTTTSTTTTTPKPTTAVHHTSTNQSINGTDAAMNLFAPNGRLVHFCGFVLCAHAIAMHHRH